MTLGLPARTALPVIAFALLALAGGLGMAHAPVLTFFLVAVVFLLGLRLVLGKAQHPPETVASGGPASREGAGGLIGGLVAGRLVSVYLLCWWVVMVAPLAAYTPREVGSRAVEATVSGSLQNQVLVASFGLVGMMFLPAAVRRVGVAFWWVMALWGIYMLWAYTSLIWSEYPAITLRNLAAYVLVSMGCFGLGAGFYGGRKDGARLFLRHLAVAGLISALVVLIPLPRYLGEFNPLDPTQRLEISGGLSTFSARPVMVAGLALVVASLAGLRRWRTSDWFVMLVLLTPILLLKTRGPFLWALLSLGVVYLLCRGLTRDRMIQSGLVAVLGLGYYVLKSGGALESISTYMTRGNEELSMTLTGRVPLWDALVPAVSERPLTGEGFSAFWNPENLYLMERLVGFPVVSAHNGFLEELLNTGAVGLALFLTFWISAMVLSVRRAVGGDPLGWVVLLFLLFYLLLNLTSSLMQDYLEVPFMVVFIGLGMMSVRSSGSPQRSPAPPATEGTAPDTLVAVSGPGSR